MFPVKDENRNNYTWGGGGNYLIKKNLKPVNNFYNILTSI